MPEKILTLRYLSITSYMKSKAQLIILHPVVRFVNIISHNTIKVPIFQKKEIGTVSRNNSNRNGKEGENAFFS
jgi:hypothetical protein